MMNREAILKPLNPEQRKIVSAPAGNMLVLAGAGSGKTRVLTSRIAWLCMEHDFIPSRILAVTFTNKAAREMRQRLEALLDGSYSLNGMWLGTFHSLCHRFLRIHWQAAGLSETFQIIDTADQRRVLKNILDELHLDREDYAPQKMQAFINKNKDRSWRPLVAAEHLSDTTAMPRQVLNNMIEVYAAYEKLCQQQFLLDFPELILRTREVLDEHEAIRAHYQQRFHCILVDEFQDTNALQFDWLKRLAGKRTPVFAVGDDDQSIYGWRGARFKNMHDFAEDFPNTRIYSLEQNYRSTAAILDLANALIRHNVGRLEKKLWTEKKGGESVVVTSLHSEKSEARFVAEQLQAWRDQGRRLSEAAVLYRSNAQSRLIEEALTSKRIAYRIYGGLRFFERAIIKDALAYFRLAHYEDDQSFRRVINQPPRGLGARSVEAIEEHADKRSCPLYQAGLSLLSDHALPARADGSLRRFYETLDKIKRSAEDLPLTQKLQLLYAESGLLEYYEAKDRRHNRNEADNLNELLAFAHEFEHTRPDDDNGLSSSDAFLAYAALATDSQADAGGDDCAQIMTMHAAKGLEFPFVIMIGMRDGLCPHIRSFEEANGLEEERRLCYVAITRACEKLVMTMAPPSSNSYSPSPHDKRHRASRFLSDVPDDLLVLQYENDDGTISPLNG